jgi:hypothetical protein
MEAQRQQALWAIALEHYQAAGLLAQQDWHNVSVACSYYAVFTAMWVALGDPPKGYWEHGGIVDWFARGDWRVPAVPIARELIRAIRGVYTDRMQAQYRAVRLTAGDSAAGLQTARQVLRLLADTWKFSFGGIVL